VIFQALLFSSVYRSAPDCDRRHHDLLFQGEFRVSNIGEAGVDRAPATSRLGWADRLTLGELAAADAAHLLLESSLAHVILGRTFRIARVDSQLLRAWLEEVAVLGATASGFVHDADHRN